MNTPPIQPGMVPPQAPPMAPRPRMKPGAIIGLVVGGCAAILLLFVAIMAAVLFPVFAHARDRARQTQCLSNQRLLATAAIMYAQDHEGRFPKTETVWTDLTTYISGGNKVLNCPGEKSLPLGYGYSNALDGVNDKTITSPATTLATADSLHSTIFSESDIAKQRHEGGYISAYCDGHAEFHPRPNKP